MSLFSMKPQIPRGSIVLLLVSALLSVGPTPTGALPKASVSYVPGVALVPEVLLADGVTDRTYTTLQGASLWRKGLPILLGDKIKLNVFASTGGAELKEIKIRLDDTRIADVSSAPWRTLLDTATMKPGYHMVEVWAQATGDRPQSATKTLMFFITKQTDTRHQVQGVQQSLSNGAVTNVPLEEGATSEVAPPTPRFLQGLPADSAAGITVTARPAASTVETGGTDVTNGKTTISEPTLFIVLPAPGSTATQFAYTLVRSGTAFDTSTAPLPINYQRIRIEKRTDTAAGLQPGSVTLWIWGLDAQGRPSDPVKVQLMIV